MTLRELLKAFSKLDESTLDLPVVILDAPGGLVFDITGGPLISTVTEKQGEESADAESYVGDDVIELQVRNW